MMTQNSMKQNSFKAILQQAGFTLLEMLVVLVIVSIISVLLIQGISYVLYLRYQFINQLNQLQQSTLQEYWFRNSTEGIIVDYRDSENIFKGNSKEFSGLTLAALEEDVGVPIAFSWQLIPQSDHTILHYHSQLGQEWDIFTSEGNEATFRYLDDEGKWHSEWPPKFGTEIPQIPRFISFEGQKNQTPIIWLVKLSEEDRTRLDIRLEDW